MKRMLMVGALVFTMAVGTFTVYADSNEVNGFSLGRGYHHMGGGEFNRGMDLNGEEREELLEKKKEFFENQSNLTDEERQELFKEMQEERVKSREERINKALEEGTMTEEQARELRAHCAEMAKLHEENGFIGGKFQGANPGRRHGGGMMGGKRF